MGVIKSLNDFNSFALSHLMMTSPLFTFASSSSLFSIFGAIKMKLENLVEDEAHELQNNTENELVKTSIIVIP